MNNRGLTLIEIIVSIAILGVLSIFFLAIFTNVSADVFSWGERGKAILKAQEKLERIHSRENSILEEHAHQQLIKLLEKDQENIEITEDTKLYEGNPSNDTIRLAINKNKILNIHGNDTEGYEVILVVFYQEGKKPVTVSTFIPL